MAPDTRTSDESAFTLIEIVVACILLAIVLGMVASGIVQGISGGSDANRDSRTRRIVADLEEQLGDDVRSARAVHRSGAYLPDPDQLRDIVLGNAPAPRDASGTLDVHDVTSATGTSLTLRTDAVSGGTPAAECVTWALRSDSAAWWVERTVVQNAASGCAGGQVVAQERVSSTTPGAAPASIFSYEITENPTRAGRLDPTRCTTRVATSSPDVDWITSVGIQIVGVEARGDRASRSRSGNLIGLRSRAEPDYRYALGCAS